MSETPPSVSESNESLEIREQTQRVAKLEFETSWQGRFIEWLKAATGIAAILGLVVAIWSANAQFGQLAESRNEDRFDRAVSRIGSTSPAERLAGVSGLELFLHSAHSTKQGATLSFLVNAAAIEPDAAVRGAILDSLASLSNHKISQQELNNALITVRDRNRGVLKALQSRFQERTLVDGKLMFEKGNDEALVGKVDADAIAPLKATAAAIAALIRNGAYAADLSGIYCIGCEFSSKTRTIDLCGASFDRSYLRDANFRNVKLQRASFDGAYLIHTDFYRADLRQAKLTAPPLVDPPVQSILVQKALWAANGPIFECADLSEADFTGSVLFGFYWTDINGAGYFPRFYGATMQNTNLKSFVLFTAVPKRAIKSDYVLPINYQQSGGYDIPVSGWKENNYQIKTYRVGETFRFTGAIPREMWPSMYVGLNSLASAKDLSAAQMPNGLRQFLDANKAAFARPIISTTCDVEQER